MAYYLDLFSPETYERFLDSDRTVAGFDDKPRTRNAAQKVRPGDKLICYINSIKRWSAILEVVDGPFRDDTPRFADMNDPYVNRFHVKPAIVLPFEKTLPIDEEGVWETLSFTRPHLRGSTTWTGPIRNPLNQIEKADAQLLEARLQEQASDSGKVYPVDPKKLRRRIRRREPSVGDAIPQPKPRLGEQERVQVPVPTPGPVPMETEVAPEGEGRESIRVQASLAEIGSRMGLDVWVPPNDRGRVEQHLDDGVPLLNRLPLSYNEVTNKTIEQIDVLWLRGRSIVRAFEVEHTTAVYSGLLRMADLLALQPNMEIRLHIVAPSERRSKVLQEIRRPVFERLEGRPLADRCTYISYEKLQDLHRIPHLAHLSDTVLNEYEERA